jgi:hypothetical protein
LGDGLDLRVGVSTKPLLYLPMTAHPVVMAVCGIRMTLAGPLAGSTAADDIPDSLLTLRSAVRRTGALSLSERHPPRGTSPSWSCAVLLKRLFDVLARPCSKKAPTRKREPDIRGTRRI